MLDWFTVVAQIINFLVLVVLLRHFLYGPIMRAVDARDARITAELQAAEEKVKEAQREAELYRRKNLELDEMRDEMVSQVRDEVHAWRDELMRRAHREAQETQAHWRRVLEDEKEAYLRQLQRHVSHQAYIVARRALAEIADADLEARVVAAFVKRLDALDDAQKAAIAREAALPDHGLVISSAFQLDEGMRRDILAAAGKAFGNTLSPSFEVSPDLLCGIELRTQGHRVAWSMADFVTAMEVHSMLSLPGMDTLPEGSHGR